VPEKRATLAAILRALDRPLVAVSGGVDSMTLAHLAYRENHAARMVHAISAAVPGEATARVRAHAAHEGWSLDAIDAGEFADPRYRANPVNRCYFCKQNLYGTIATRFEGTILSGTNTDDLGDFRPGLKAADEHRVRHPFVEAGLAKSDVRAFARELRLDDLAELPAAPCLSSRVETGIAVEPVALRLIETVEARLRQALGPAAIRCRVVASGVRLEFGEPALSAYLSPRHAALRESIEATINGDGRALVGVAPYRQGSAFLHGAHG
jgi:pyridinium-3,5-biscarboxylic acid mononucleotide sulfurtransferase